MSKIIFSFIFAIFLIASAATNIFACDCIRSGNDDLQELVEFDYKNSEAVFSGEVIGISKNPGSLVVKVKFKIEKSWKNISQEEVSLIASNNDECGYVFKIGKRYLVYAQGKVNNLETSICTRTSNYESNKDINFLNQIKKPEIISSPK